MEREGGGVCWLYHHARSSENNPQQESCEAYRLVLDIHRMLGDVPVPDDLGGWELPNVSEENKPGSSSIYDVPFPGLTICLNRKVSFYAAQKWLAEKNASLPFNLIDSDVKLSYHPEYRSVEHNSFVDQSSISKEEAFVFLRVKYETKYISDNFLRLEEIPGGEFFKCSAANPVDEYKYKIEEIQAGIVTFPPPYPTDRDGPNEGVRVGYPDVSRRRVPQLKPLLIPTDSTQVRPRMVVRGLRYKSILLSTGQLTTGAFTI